MIFTITVVNYQTVVWAENLSFREHQEKKEQSGDEHIIKEIELKQTKVVDALRLIAELSGVSAVATQEAAEKETTLFLENVTARDAIDTLCKVNNLWYRQDKRSGIYRIMTTEEYQKDLVVFREDVTRIFTLLHPNVVSIATAIEDLYGDRVELSFGEDGDDLVSDGEFGQFGFGGGSGGSNSRSNSRSNDFGDDRSSNNRNFRRSTRRDDKSDRIVDEKLTADQIAQLEQRMQQEGVGGDLISFDALRGISRQEAPIFVTINREHNLILVRTSDLDALEDIARLIRDVDRPTPQVLLEMKILELALGDDFKSIFDLDYAEGDSFSGPSSSQQKNPLLSTDATAQQNVLGAGNFPLESSTLVYQYLDNKVRLRVQLLASENRVNILATPMILASNNRSAKVFVGEERVLTTGVSTDVITSSTGPTSTVVEPTTEVRDIGNTLEILPKINADRTVTLFIRQDTSSVLAKSASIPIVTSSGAVQEFAIDTVSTANIEGVVVAKDGLTIAIGGLIKSTVSESLQKVPVLGDIPVLGKLFRKEVEDNDKTEIVLLITPHVLMTPAEGQQKSEELMEKLSHHPFHKGEEPSIDSHFENKNIFEDEDKGKSKSDQWYKSQLEDSADNKRHKEVNTIKDKGLPKGNFRTNNQYVISENKNILKEKKKEKSRSDRWYKSQLESSDDNEKHKTTDIIKHKDFRKENFKITNQKTTTALNSGKILDVDQKNNFAMINLGEGDGIEPGDILLVYRDDRFIDKVKVGTMRTSVSAVYPMVEGNLKNIQSGDQIKVSN
mgnify:FL=1